jgi:membrane-bound lytic murein transglycosylase B
VRIGGRWGAHPAVDAVRQRAQRVASTRVTRPAFGIAVITPLVFAGAVSGSPPPFPGKLPAVRAAVAPLAAVSPVNPAADQSGPSVVALQRPPTAFHLGSPTLSAPPPPMVVSAPGALGIPTIALTAYRSAEMKMAVSNPNCGISWNLLAGIGRIESGHASNGAVDAQGTAVRPIYGPSLDGSLPGNEVIVQSTVGNRPTYARAMGPMQFLPGTWAKYADTNANPQNLFDATLAAARYLCSGGLNLRDSSQVMAAILRYNNSMAYAQNVLGWAAAYATGVVPVDLPPITGPPPPLADAHLENREGLGPSLPMNINGLPLYDPIAQTPLIDLSGTPPNGQQPWATNGTQPTAPPVDRIPGCTLICIGTPGGGPGSPGPGPARQPDGAPSAN